MIPDRARKAPPKAGPMVEALRGLGYSVATALADLVDNSISAKARTIKISFHWEGEQSFITILDDGTGMSAEELERAMRLGELSPLKERSVDDLGRFGLGLKTASFSQARRLTVASRCSGKTSCLRWDLDVLTSSPTQEWWLLEGTHEGSEARIEPLETQESGTIVIWEELDRIVTRGSAQQDFLDLIDRVEQHLSMVFHRFLVGSDSRIKLLINEYPVSPWDPFLAGHPATWHSPTVELAAWPDTVTVSGYVLPHKDKLSEADYHSAGGPEGWTAQQGFYVYRNRRLLVAGSWLGLGRSRLWTKEEAFRLARLCLDIPNTADAEWKIDIRKSKARPPVTVRERLMRIAEDTRDRARKVFAHRGQILQTAGREPIAQAWRSDHFKGGVRYRIDREHPAIRAVLEEAGPLTTQLQAMLRVIEETIPVQRIWLDTAEARETPRTAFALEPDPAVYEVLLVLYRNLIKRKGLTPSEARAQLLRSEPFNNHPTLITTLPDDPG